MRIFIGNYINKLQDDIDEEYISCENPSDKLRNKYFRHLPEGMINKLFPLCASYAELKSKENRDLYWWHFWMFFYKQKISFHLIKIKQILFFE